MRGSTKGPMAETFYVKPYLPKKGNNDFPTFVFTNRQKEEVDRQTAFSGKLVGVEVDSYVYEGEEILTTKFRFLDRSVDEYYILQMPFSYTTRPFFNAFLSMDPKDPADRELEVSVTKMEGKNRMFVALKGDEGKYQNLAWKFSPNEEKKYVSGDGVCLPEIVKVGKNYDTTEIDEFLHKALAEWGEEFKNTKSQNSPNRLDESGADEEPDDNFNESESDDLPF
jgi:hypothetical protein